jgi:hypothetical protein
MDVDALRSDERLRELLAAYVERRRFEPEAEWHDRVMEMEGCTPEELTKLHGRLLADGWIETRVHGDAFRRAGRLEACYRATHEGVRALRQAQAEAGGEEKDGTAADGTAL